MNRALILAEAREWLGTRWQHQASVKGKGCDCIGLVAGVARSVGVAEAVEFFYDPRVRGYGRHPNPDMLTAACARYMDRVDLIDRRPADVLVLRFDHDPQHFAFLSRTDPDYIIHAYAQVRKVVENRIDALWRSRIVSAWRLRGIDG
jgi:NlpC/P60 family putative phage cell wall peptidase